MNFENTLARKTYDAIGHEEFIKYLYTLDGEEVDELLDFNSVYSSIQYDDNLIIIGVTYEYEGKEPDNPSMIKYIERKKVLAEAFDSDDLSRGTSVYCLGQKKVTPENMELGTLFVKYSVYEKARAVGSGVKREDDYWEVSDTASRAYADEEVADLIETIPGYIKFYFDGEEVKIR